MKFLLTTLLAIGSIQMVQAYEEPTEKGIQDTAVNRVYDYFKSKGVSVYVAEWNQINGISSIASPSLTDLSKFRGKALELFKAGKGTKFPSGAILLAFDKEGNPIDLSSMAK
jgi:hypothetical protein